MTHTMAKLTKLPSLAIIDGFRGTLDFFITRGIPCVRKWPQSPGKNRSAAVRAQWAPFAFASREWKNLTPTVQEAYNRLATNSGLTGRDMMTRAYLQGLYRYPTP